jgi:hypothetical protein
MGIVREPIDLRLEKAIRSRETTNFLGIALAKFGGWESQVEANPW